MRWPSNIWSGMLGIFLNSDTKYNETIKNDWTTGQKVILVIEHWNLRVLSFRDIMVARELLSKNLFLWKVFWNQSLWNLFTRSNTCLRCAVLSLMLRLLMLFITPLTLSQKDKLTISITLPSRFTKKSTSLTHYSSKMFICMKNGKQKTQLGSVSVLNLIVASIFLKKSHLN